MPPRKQRNAEESLKQKTIAVSTTAVGKNSFGKNGRLCLEMWRGCAADASLQRMFYKEWRGYLSTAAGFLPSAANRRGPNEPCFEEYFSWTDHEYFPGKSKVDVLVSLLRRHLVAMQYIKSTDYTEFAQASQFLF